MMLDINDITTNAHQQHKPPPPPPPPSPPAAASYSSKLCSFVSTWKRSFFTTTQDDNTTTTLSKKESDDIDQDYYMIQSIHPPTSVQATLNLINQLKLSSSEENLLTEFQKIKDNLIFTCHQFDEYKLIDQFSNTDQKIGSELRLFIQFMITRYSNSWWLTLMGLLMIAIEVLKTQGEVKCQLMYQTRIGRDLVLAMHDNLFNNKPYCGGGDGGGEIESGGILKIIVINEEESSRKWFDVLKRVCFELADYDPSWTIRETYYQVVSMTTTRLLLDDKI